MELKIARAVLLVLLLGSRLGVEADGLNHKYKEGDRVPLYANKVGPFHNPSETYRFYNLPFCSPGEIQWAAFILLCADCTTTQLDTSSDWVLQTPFQGWMMAIVMALLSEFAGVYTERAKLKEIAKRRAKELQMEEEERIREQKAKALAKLEELNKRTSSRKTQDSEVKVDAIIIEGPAQNTDSLTEAVNDERIKILSWPVDLPTVTTVQVHTQASAVSHDPSLSVGQESSNPEIFSDLTSSDVQGNADSKRNQMGSRRRPNVSETSDSLGIRNNTDEVTVPMLSRDGLPNNDETTVHNRRRNNRNPRGGKNKLDETMITKAETTTTEKNSKDGGNTQPLTSVAQSVGGSQGSSSNQGKSQPSEKANSRAGGSQYKPQSTSRKTTRNQQAGNETVVWAPVKPARKVEPSEEVTREANNHSSGKFVQNPGRSKRAELERYMPKAVAKEVLLQDNTQPPSPVDQVSSETVTRSGDSNKQRGKMRVSWRQRNPTEPLQVSIAGETCRDDENQPLQQSSKSITCTSETPA